MFNISEYFKKFSKINDTKEGAVLLFKKVARSCGVDLEKYSISFTHGTFTVTCPHVVKNVLFIKKETILEMVNKGGIKANNIV